MAAQTAGWLVQGFTKDVGTGVVSDFGFVHATPCLALGTNAGAFALSLVKSCGWLIAGRGWRVNLFIIA